MNARCTTIRTTKTCWPGVMSSRNRSAVPKAATAGRLFRWEKWAEYANAGRAESARLTATDCFLHNGDWLARFNEDPPVRDRSRRKMSFFCSTWKVLILRLGYRNNAFSISYPKRLIFVLWVAISGKTLQCKNVWHGRLYGTHVEDDTKEQVARQAGARAAIKS